MDSHSCKIPIRTIIIECSTLLRGNTGIGRWIELFLTELPKLGWDVVRVDRSNFGINDGMISEYTYYNFLLPRWLQSFSPKEAIFLVPDNLSKFLRCPHPNTIYFMHDLIQLSPEVGYKGLRLKIFKFKLKLLKNATAIFTTTSEVKKDLLSIKWLQHLKIMELGGLVGDDFFGETKGTKPDVALPDKFILAVGTGEPRKNVSALLNAYMRDIDNELPDLVLYGGDWRRKGWANINKESLEKGIAHRIHHAGSVNDQELIWLYSHALAFVFLSQAEGFGLPPIEALTRGTQVVVNDLPVFREVLGDFAWYAASEDPLSVISAVKCAIKAGSVDGRDFIKSKYSAQQVMGLITKCLAEID